MAIRPHSGRRDGRGAPTPRRIGGLKRILVEASARAGATLGRVVLVVALMLFPDSAAAGNSGHPGAVGAAEPCRGTVVRDERAAPSSQDTVDLLLYGGWRQLWGGDVNEAVADATGRWAGAVLRDPFMPLAEGDAPTARRGAEYGLRFAAPLSGSFRFVGGIGWVDGDSVGRVVETPVTPERLWARSAGRLELRAVSAWIGVGYRYAWGRKLSVLVDGGAGLYRARLRWSQQRKSWRGERTRGTPLFEDERVWDVRGYTPSLHGGVSVDVHLSGRMGVIFGVHGVHATVGNLEGRRRSAYRGGHGEGVWQPTEDRRGTVGVARLNDGRLLTGLIEADGGLDELRPVRLGLGGLRYSGGLRVAVGGGREGLGNVGSDGNRGARRMDVRMYGGLRQLWGGDVNEAVARELRSNVSDFGRFHDVVVSVDEDAAPAARSGGEYGADLVFHLNPRVGLVGGIGWLQSSSVGRAAERPGSGFQYPSRASANLDLRAVALRLGAQYTYPAGRRLGLHVDGGIGVYRSRIRWSQRVELDLAVPPIASEWSTNVLGYGLGFHAGFAADLSLTERIGVIVGVRGVRADVDGLEGVRESAYEGFRGYTLSRRESGTLGILEFSNRQIGPFLGFVEKFLEDEPSWVEALGPIRDIREAAAGLSGLRYTGGLRVSF